MPPRKLGVLLFALAMLASCSTPSAEPDETRSIFADRDPAALELAEALTRDYLDDNEGTVLRGVDGVESRGIFFDDLGEAHTRLVQTLDGIPVFGAEAVVHLNADGSAGALTDGFFRDLRVDTTAVLTAPEAIEIAVLATGGWGAVTGTPAADMQILRHDGLVHLTWRVQLRQFEGSLDPAMPVVFVDAHAGDVVWQYDNLKDVQLSDADKRAYDMHHGTSYNGASIADSSDAVANDAYVNSGLTLDYYLAAHGRDSFDGVGTRVDSYVHYSTDYVNAFWDGSVLTFGDGDGYYSGPLVSLDIVAHEFSHGVTDYEANLIYADESGALNEATSDIFAAAIEAREGGSYTDIWYVGEDVWLADTALRYMDDPARAGDYDYYPTRYTGYSDNGGVHWNSGIANLYFHLLSEGGTHPRGTTSNVVTGIGIDAAAAIWYRALTVYMVPSTDFAGARAATVAAAGDLNAGWVSSVEQAWDAVGVAAPPAYTELASYPNLSGTTGARIDFGPFDATSCTAMKFQITGGSGDADLYVRFGAPPTLSQYDCRPWLWGNEETCEFNPSAAGSYYVMLDAYSSYSGVTLTVDGACGATDPEMCDDGIDNDLDGDIDCDDADCDTDPACAPPPAEICDDGIDNDLDGDTDCADTDCAGDPACESGTWDELSYTDFESGWGVWADGGSDARRQSTSYAHQGGYAVQIRDNSGQSSSFYSASSIDLSGYSELEIDFWFYARSMENNEDFFVELYDGSSWQTIARFARGADFDNNTYYHPVLTVTDLDVDFTASARLRFRCDASNNSDYVYIDEVLVSAR